MACRGFWSCLLKLLNLLMTLAGLAMVGYGIYLLVEYMSASDDSSVSPSSYEQSVIQFGRPILAAVSLSSSITLPKAWYESCSFSWIIARLSKIVVVPSCKVDRFGDLNSFCCNSFGLDIL